MDIRSTHQQQKQRDIDNHNEDERLKQESKEGKPHDKQQSPQSPASPRSASSSPSHEFSFTISLHSTTSTSVQTDKTKASAAASSSSFAIDLSPADDIFFHGHLLPLHFLSHLPVSPRSSTNSLDNFHLPKKDLLDESKPKKQQQPHEKKSYVTGYNSIINKSSQQHRHNEIKGKNKSMSLSQIILGLKKWRRGYQERGKERQEEGKEKDKRKLRHEVSQAIKKYARMVRPLLPFKGKRDDVECDQFYDDRQSYNSYSGNLSLRRDRQVLTGKQGQYSAPASMSTSPTNSGLLVATSPLSSSTSDSTMEELQAAIQSAIAHCKNSIAKG